MLESESIFWALQVLCRASDSDLLPFVTQLTPVYYRLQTLSSTWSNNLRAQCVNNESSILVLPWHISATQAPIALPNTSSIISQKDATPASRIASEYAQPHPDSIDAANNDRQEDDKGQARAEQLLNGAKDCFDDIIKYVCQEPDVAVGQPSWTNEHPAVVDLQIQSSDSKPSSLVLFRKALAQLELAKGYLQFEKAKYGSSKVERLVENLHQKGTGHITEYLQTQGDVQDKEAARKGIRHGIKHLVIREHLKRSLEASRELHDWENVDGISAIFAFSYTRCRDLKYPDIPSLIRMLSSRFNQILQLAKTSSDWFRTCQALYTENTKTMKPTAPRKRQRTDVSTPHTSDENQADSNISDLRHIHIPSIPAEAPSGSVPFDDDWLLNLDNPVLAFDDPLLNLDNPLLDLDSPLLNLDNPLEV